MNPLSLIRARTLVVVLCLVGLELALYHVGNYGKWTVQERNRFVGWRMLPNQSGLSRDFTVDEDINSYGFRDREWDPPPVDADGRALKDEGLFRVAVVGNSMTYGTSVPVELVWTRQLEERLQAELDRRGDTRRVLVMNFAVQGYVFEQMLRCFHVNIRRIVGEVRWPEDEDGDGGPEFESEAWFRPDVMIVPTLPHDAAPMMPASDDPEYGFRRWVIRSATYDMLRERVIDRWIPRPKTTVSAEAAAIQKADRDMQRQPYAESNMHHWHRTGKLMAELLEAVEADGGRLLLVNLPVKHPLLNEGAPTTSVRWKPWSDAIGDTDGRRRVVHWEPIGKFRRAMPDLLPLLRDGGILPDDKGGQRIDTSLPHLEQSVFLLDDLGHYSELGHALLAEEVFEAIVRAGML